VDVAEGMRAADRAVVAREMARAAAQRLGHRAIFSPILDPAGVGNGVHIHFSFKDAAGVPVMHEPADPLGLSPVARAFVAGILHHQPALCALTAPSTISYVRLRPNRWAPTHATLEQQDRAAALRICPVMPGPNVAKQFNVEYRVADGAASPYIALAAVVWAGVDGIRRGLAIPDEGPALPASLEQALDALEASEAARGWMGESFHGAYLMHKRGEAALMAGLTEAEQCARYEATY
jgi:glutamine synthetase